MIRFARPIIDKTVSRDFKKILSSGVLVHGKYTNLFENKL